MSTSLSLPTTPSSTRPTMATHNQHERTTIIQKRWLCDVCRHKWFLDYDEACAHEAVCAEEIVCRNEKKRKNERENERSERGVSERGVKEKKVRERGVDVKVVDDSVGSARSTKRAKAASSKTREEVIDISSDDSSVKPTVRRSRRVRSKESEQPSAPNDAGDEDKTGGKAVASVFKQAKSNKEAKSKKKDKNNLNEEKKKTSSEAKKEAKSKKEALPQKLLAEHTAATFFAKRKQALAQERERQKRREEARLGKKKSSTFVVGEREVDLTLFPVPSHVNVELDTACEMNLNYKPIPRGDLTKGTPEPMANLSFLTSPPQNTSLFSIFQPSKTKSNTKSKSTKLWADKHAFTPSSILGPQNRQAAQKLSNFIDQWKIRRHKSVSRTKNRGGRRRSGYESDDSFLSSDGGRTSLFLLTGPTASGKSKLVHAISKSLECVVMELNTGDIRNGGMIKKLGESTVSHSSVALMKKRQYGVDVEDGESGGGKGGGGGGKLKEKEFFDESSSDEEEGSSLTVIVIDEVDLLFKNAGDTSFWPSLSTLTQRAKSPIILTATDVPPELDGFQYDHVHLSRPSVEECALKMMEVARSEGLELKSEAVHEGVERVAEFYECDLRRILNEMQLFCGSNMLSTQGEELVVFPREKATKSDVIADNGPIITSIEPEIVPRECHTLITIHGRNFFQSTLYMGDELCPRYRVVSDFKILAVCPPLKIPPGVSKGLVYTDNHEVKCLSSKFVDISVRKQCIHGLFLDNTPWNIEYNVPIECSLLDQKLAMSKRDFIQKAKAQRERLIGKDEGFMSSDEEMEFESEHKPLKRRIEDSSEDESVEEGLEGLKVAKDVDPGVLLEEALEGVMIEQPNEAKNPSIIESAFKDIDVFAEEMGRMSDVAFLEDALLGLPMLAGAVEGLGSNSINDVFTDSVPADPDIDKLSKDQQRPSFESLCLGNSNKDGFFYGTSNAYMVQPCRRRERALLSNAEMHSRGLGALDDSIEQDSLDKGSSDLGTIDELESYEAKPSLSNVQSEDEMLLTPQTLCTSLILDSVLGESLLEESSSIYQSNKDDSPWLHLRMREMSFKSLETMANLLVPEHSLDWNKICFGIRHSEQFTVSSHQSQLSMANYCMENTLALDYLPFLRGMAFHENKMQLALKKVMNGTDSRRSRASKRRKPCRAHYLDECCGKKYGDLEHDLMELGDSYLMKDL